MAAGGLVSSADQTAIAGGDSNHIVDVQGTVVAGGFSAISFNGGAGQTNEYVLVESTGFVGSYAGWYAIEIDASSSIVENHGKLYATGLSSGYGVGFLGGGTSQLINTGTIEGKVDAVV